MVCPADRGMQGKRCPILDGIKRDLIKTKTKEELEDLVMGFVSMMTIDHYGYLKNFARSHPSPVFNEMVMAAELDDEFTLLCTERVTDAKQAKKS